MHKKTFSKLELIDLSKGDESVHREIDILYSRLFENPPEDFRFNELSAEILPDIDQGILTVALHDDLPMGYVKFYLKKDVNITDYITKHLDIGDFPYFIDTKGEKVFPFEVVERLGLQDINDVIYTQFSHKCSRFSRYHI